MHKFWDDHLYKKINFQAFGLIREETEPGVEAPGRGTDKEF